jgi:GT2 family glycosyltransferase
MLVLDILRYLVRKLDRRPVHLTNLVPRDDDHLTPTLVSEEDSKVSIIIPTRDKHNLLQQCVDSVVNVTRYPNFEIIIVDYSSSSLETKRLLDSYRDKGIVVLSSPGKFNYSKICNYGASMASGKYLCFLNNDTIVQSPNWLASMVHHAKREDVAVVGAILTYPNGSIQHMGIALGYTGVAGHPNRNLNPRDCVPESCFVVSAVTFACAVIDSIKFRELGRLNEKFPAGFNDLDLSMQATARKLKNIVCVSAHLTHVESQSRPRSLSTKGIPQTTRDVLSFLAKYGFRRKDSFFTR